MPMFGRSPNPSSSRTLTPGTFRSASVTVKTRELVSVAASTTVITPGSRRSVVVESPMRVPTTLIASEKRPGSSVAVTWTAPSPTRTTCRLVEKCVASTTTS